MHYDIKYIYTKKSAKNLKKIPNKDKILSVLDREVVKYLDNGIITKNMRKVEFMPGSEYESTLFIINVMSKYVAFLTIDEDPIFEQVLVKVFFIGGRDKGAKEVNGIQESIYQRIINGVDEEDIDEDEVINNG